MKIDIARQSLLPALLTLIALAVALGVSVSGDVVPAPAVAAAQIGGVLHKIQGAFPLLSQIVTGLLIFISGWSVGRFSTRYNLYSANSCIAIPLFGIIVYGVLDDGNYLAGITATMLLVLSLGNFIRAHQNGYAFDNIFRASFLLGMLPLISVAALPILLLLPLATILFQRTLREFTVAVIGAILPLFIVCYIGWGQGELFLMPLHQLQLCFESGNMLSALLELRLYELIFIGVIHLLVLGSVLFFLADTYSATMKARAIFLFNIGILLITDAILCLPCATNELLVLTAIPASILLPALFVRIHRAIALPLYLGMLGFVLCELLFQ